MFFLLQMALITFGILQVSSHSKLQKFKFVKIILLHSYDSECQNIFLYIAGPGCWKGE